MPLPVPMAGNDSGMFQFPPEGTLVEVAFTGGRPDTIDLLAELAQQCASHSHPSVGTPTNAGAFTRTATKAGQTRSKYQNIIA
ncbi:hypothetical protein KXR48_003383 [Escherichia coli]|nr:hypothetical protein [Escherichia coli]